MNKKLQVNSEEELQRRVEEISRKIDEWEEVKKRVEKLERDQVDLLKEIVSIHESDAELGKILMDLFQRINQKT